MQDKNIDLFNKYTGIILKKLYDSFPVCNNISVLEVINFIDIKDDTTKQKELICSETLFWLKDSGIITFISLKNSLSFL